MAEAERHNAGKPDLHYLHPWYDAMCEVARVCMKGEEKYDRGNYLLGQDWVQLLSAGERHAFKFGSFRHPDRDEESGCVHLAHDIWNKLQLLQSYLDGETHRDNRLKPPVDKPSLWKRVSAWLKSS